MTTPYKPFVASLTASLVLVAHGLGCGIDDPETQPVDAEPAGDTAPSAADAETSTSDATDSEGSGAPVGGLIAEATVFRDQWGVAHIYASHRADLFYLQGYEMARDRLWHLDFLRHFIYGTQSSVFGPDFLEDDLLKRGLGVRAIVEVNQEFYRENYPEVFAELEAFARGVNQYLEDAQGSVGGATMPLEFDRIPGDYTMRPWEVADTLAIAKALILSQSFQPDLELVAFAGLTLLGDDFRELYPFTPLMPVYALEESPSSQDDLSTDWRAGQARDKNRREPGYLAPEVVEAFSVAIDALVTATGRDDISGLGGSNAFAVADDMSTNGHAMLCNDTHMTMDLPSTLYPMHLVLEGEGGFESFGYDAPGSPYTLIGTNSRVAWGLTNAYGDVTDLYREEFSDDGLSVLYNGEFVPLEIIDEPIPVRLPDGTVDESNRARIRVVPHHGPILNDVLPGDIGQTLNNFGFVFSIRWTGFNDQTSELVTFSRMLAVADNQEAIEAFERFDGGVMNLTFADVSGEIAYIPAGPFPQRNWDLADAPPYLPLPGTGEYEWDERIPYASIPRLLDPAKGYLANANASISNGTFDNVPETGDFYFHHFVDLGTRAWRLTQRLEEMKAAGGASMADLRALQLDTYSVQASIYVPVLTDAWDELCDSSTDSRRCEAIDYLRQWDYHQDVDSVAATLYNQWVLYFWWNTYVDQVSSLVFDLVASDLDNGPGRGIGHWLLGRPPISGTDYFDDTRTADVQETALDIALGALDEALDALDAYYEGAPMSEWRWDEAHFVQLTHQVWDDLDHGPFGIGSGFRTVNAADYRLVTDGEISNPPFVMNESPQIRFCVEMDPAGPRVLGGLMGGASARGESPHYLDQFDNWLNGVDIPIVTTRPAVEADAQSTINYPVGFPANRP